MDTVNLCAATEPGAVQSLAVDKSVSTPGDLTLSWTASCGGGATDYGIFEGTIGSWYSHTQIDCVDDAADLTEDVSPGAGSRYYLLVPLTATEEGSYGKNGSSVERPTGTTTCQPVRIVATCG